MESNASQPTELVGTSAAARTLGVSGNTLRRWAKSKLIDFELTPGGQRRFDVRTLRGASSPADRVQNLAHTANHQCQQREQTDTKAATGAIYCRVSSAKQKDDLARQVQSMQAEYPGFSVYKDVASGLNYKRKGLQRLLGHVQDGVVNQVVVAHRDRLARFGVELVEWIITRAGASLVFLDQGDQSKRGSSEELAEDLLAVVHVFSCRANGRRRYKRSHKGGEDSKIGSVQGAKRRRKSVQEERTGCSAGAQSDTVSVDQAGAVQSPGDLVVPLVQGHPHDVQPGHGAPAREENPPDSSG